MGQEMNRCDIDLPKHLHQRVLIRERLKDQLSDIDMLLEKLQ